MRRNLRSASADRKAHDAVCVKKSKEQLVSSSRLLSARTAANLSPPADGRRAAGGAIYPCCHGEVRRVQEAREAQSRGQEAAARGQAREAAGDLPQRQAGVRPHEGGRPPFPALPDHGGGGPPGPGPPHSFSCSPPPPPRPPPPPPPGARRR